jgi:queuine/archaeosine tRNA-ribosyltransferase
MFDSGGYQVQMGKIAYEELFDRLQRFYEENRWADWYVLPDHVPGSTDSDEEVEFKVQETIDFARLFLHRLPDLKPRALGVVHGRTPDQIRRCVEAYARMGIRYVGFGSFGTSGPNGAVNLVSSRSLSLLCLAQTIAREYDLRLHIFGIGSPGYLVRLADAGITPSSFDSAGWWKAGAFGNIFFPEGPQLHITAMPTWETTTQGVLRAKKQSHHQCAFCAKVEELRRSRMARIMHNLSALMDTLELMERGNSGEASYVSRPAEYDS